MGSYATKFEVSSLSQGPAKATGDILVVPVMQKKPAAKSKTSKAKDTATMVWDKVHGDLDKACGGALKAALSDEQFDGSAGKVRTFRPRTSDDVKARWVVFVGLGTEDKLSLAGMTKAYSAALKATYKFKNTATACVLMPKKANKLSTVQMAQAVVCGGVESTYQTAEADKDKMHKLKKVQLIPHGRETLSKTDVTQATIIAMAESFTKDLANMPANLKKAETLAKAARSLKTTPGVTVTVVSDQKKLQKDMPCFWAVAQGAAEVDPPRFIKIKYTPAGKTKPKKRIALVGKGVIFDTGGVQVKTGNYMNGMKFDMTGAATVLGVMKAAIELKLKGVEICMYVAATQNLTGELAYLPDSIVDTSSGKKVEIMHTDAEGRLTLADAVYKATLDKPDEMVTIATLTGSAGLAVGHCTALMGVNDGLVSRLDKAGKQIGERIQPFEMHEEDFSNVKSDRDAADLRNTGKQRERGHLTAGAFVMSFAGDVPIAHMDIAGGDNVKDNASGIAVKGLIQYLMNEATA